MPKFKKNTSPAMMTQIPHVEANSPFRQDEKESWPKIKRGVSGTLLGRYSESFLTPEDLPKVQQKDLPKVQKPTSKKVSTKVGSKLLGGLLPRKYWMGIFQEGQKK